MFRSVSILPPAPSCISLHQTPKLLRHFHQAPLLNAKPKPPPVPQNSVAKKIYIALNHGNSARSKSGDKARVSIVSSELCDHVLERLAPSLEDYKGCDIIDINPGACVWSEKLHAHLKPRSHILLEPDTAAYEQFYKPLLEEKDSTYKLIPQSGLLWPTLNALPQELPNQPLLESGDPRQDLPNKTLLFTANLGYLAGKKKYGGFTSIAHLVVHQLMSACRNHTIFQRYGLIRMLIWMDDKEKAVVTPRVISQRTKYTMETEISCESIVEVASVDEAAGQKIREHALELERAMQLVEKMEREGIRTPPGRAGKFQVEATKQLKDPSPVKLGPQRTWHQDLEIAEARWKRGEILRYEGDNQDVKYNSRIGLKRKRTAEYDALLKLRYRAKGEAKTFDLLETQVAEYLSIIEKGKGINELPTEEADNRREEIRQLLEAFLQEQEKYHFNHTAQLLYRADDRLAFYHDPPILNWDRRPYEPLLVQPDDFFPPTELALLDMQPRALAPIFRDPNNYDHFEFLAATCNMLPTQSVASALRSLAPGALEWLVPECPSLTDASKLGSPNLDTLRVRMLTQEHWKELLTAWLNWPFRPTDGQIMSRLGNVADEIREEEEAAGTAMGKDG